MANVDIRQVKTFWRCRGVLEYAGRARHLSMDVDDAGGRVHLQLSVAHPEHELNC